MNGKREVIQPTQADSIRLKLDLVEWHPCYDTSKWGKYEDAAFNKTDNLQPEKDATLPQELGQVLGKLLIEVLVLRKLLIQVLVFGKLLIEVPVLGKLLIEVPVLGKLLIKVLVPGKPLNQELVVERFHV
nr:hypothetical protein Iba_chr10bCG10560 [Ipomoea batatas]